VVEWFSGGEVEEAEGRASVTWGEGGWGEGEPDNGRGGLRGDQYEAPDHSWQRNAMASAFFGSEDSIAYIDHNAELLEASKKAKAKLPALRKAFQAGFAPGEFLLVKAPFATPDGGNEWMWVEIAEWSDDGSIRGLLQNEPFNIPNLHAGQEVAVKEADLFDYIHQKPDGTQTRNTTRHLIEKMQR